MKHTSFPELQIAIEALDRISRPLHYLEMEAEAEGASLNGAVAIQLCNDASWLKEIASKALDEIHALQK